MRVLSEKVKEHAPFPRTMPLSSVY